MNRVAITKFPPLSYACNEALNTLCTNLSFSGEDVRKIMLTSCHASEGKSFLSMNIMRTMAKLGKSVVLVDADLRRSAITNRYGIKHLDSKKKWGLAHLLAGMVTEDEVVYQTDIEGAYMVPIGKEVNNSLPLLNSNRLRHLLDHLAEKVDYVLVDAPPVGTIIDAAQIAKSCDGTLLVVNYNTVHRQELIDAKRQLDQSGCPILGTVLNGVEYDDYLSRKYYYKSQYSNYEHYEKSSKPATPAARDEVRSKKA